MAAGLATFIQASAHSLPMLADGSVQAVITSPPYYSLRSYAGEQAVEWPAVTFRLNEWCEPVTVPGCDPNCEHEWTDGPVVVQQAQRDSPGGFQNSQSRGLQTNTAGKAFATTQGSYCAKCGGWRGGLGMEPSPVAYIGHLILCLREWRRVLHDTGVCFVNLGDSYASNGQNRNGLSSSVIGSGPDGACKQRAIAGQSTRNVPDGVKSKDLLMIPAMFALAARADGWYLRSAITWCKGNPMPESVQGSHFIRHRVTIEAYEELSRLREEQRRNQDRASHLPGVQAGEGAGSEAALSAKREGESNGAGAGRTRGREGETARIQPLTPGAIEQSQVRSNGKGQGHAEEGDSQVPEHGEGQTVAGGLLRENEERSLASGRGAASERALRPVREDEGEEAAGLCQTQGCGRCGTPGDCRGLAGDCETAQEPLPLLRQETSIDAGSRDTLEQGRAAREREYRASVPQLQLEEEGQDDSSLLVDCPGCTECEPHGGYILRLSAGRPTKATEQVFLLAKSPNYFYDSTAVQTSTGANQRDFWLINTQPVPFAHFACWPERLVEPMVKAGTSERGACPHCGTPWERVTEREPGARIAKALPQDIALRAMGHHGNGGLANGPEWTGTKTRTLGFRPACTCPAHEPVPCVVLDPFSGSGTTAKVAVRLGRRAIGVDVSAEYLDDVTAERFGDGVQMELIL